MITVTVTKIAHGTNRIPRTPIRVHELSFVFREPKNVQLKDECVYYISKSFFDQAGTCRLNLALVKFKNDTISELRRS